jgi:hypothetical protein
MRCIDGMHRTQLLDAIRARWEFLPADLRLRIDEQSIDRLRLILLAIRLMYFLRNTKDSYQVRMPVGAPELN